MLTLNNIDSYSINDLLNKEIPCSCGKVHHIHMKKTVIEAGAINKIPKVLKELGYKKALVLSDKITWNIAANKVTTVLQENIFPFEVQILEGRIIPNEARIGEILINTPKDVDILLAVGTGVICDMGKLIAYKMGIELGAVITAPSVDGFASQHAALVIGKLKVSYNTMCPSIIIGDTDILKNAPMPMIIAGWCDIMGKFSALSDWQISHLVNNEYYCEVISKMVKKSVHICKENLEKIKKREPEAIQAIMESLILTGIAMSFIGNSRPASGSEHHLSHCWEMKALEDGKKLSPHGIQVGVGEIIISTLYEWLSNKEVDFSKAKIHIKSFNKINWEKNVHTYFGNNSDGIIKEIKADKRYSLENSLKRLASIEKNWNDITTILNNMPTAKQMKQLIKDAEAATTPQEINLSIKEIIDSIKMAKEVRPKYTILGLLDDLNLLNDFADKMKKTL